MAGEAPGDCKAERGKSEPGGGGGVGEVLGGPILRVGVGANGRCSESYVQACLLLLVEYGKETSFFFEFVFILKIPWSDRGVLASFVA